jgi:hypothetical protein
MRWEATSSGHAGNTAGVREDPLDAGPATGGAAMARSDFHVALANALDLAMPPEVPQEYDIDALVDQCIALLERAGWEFSRLSPATRRRDPHSLRPA